MDYIAIGFNNIGWIECGKSRNKYQVFSTVSCSNNRSRSIFLIIQNTGSFLKFARTLNRKLAVRDGRVDKHNWMNQNVDKSTQKRKIQHNASEIWRTTSPNWVSTCRKGNTFSPLFCSIHFIHAMYFFSSCIVVRRTRVRIKLRARSAYGVLSMSWYWVFPGRNSLQIN